MISSGIWSRASLLSPKQNERITIPVKDRQNGSIHPRLILAMKEGTSLTIAKPYLHDRDRGRRHHRARKYPMMAASCI